MSKVSPSRAALPAEALAALARLGGHLALARVRRKESQRQWAQRIGVSAPTLIRLERGDPAVGMGIYAAALWMIGRASALSDLADPHKDLGALESDLRAAAQTRAVRSRASIEARLSKKAGKQ